MDQVTAFFASVVDWVELHPASGPVLLTAALAASGVIALGVWKWIVASRKQSVPAEPPPTRHNPYMDPVFYSWRSDYHIVCVHEYVPSSDASGWNQTQHNRPEEWGKLISVKTSWFGLRREVVPADPKAHLVVLIRPTNHAREKHILFNR